MTIVADNAQFTRDPIDTGFSQTPHGLWTLDVSPGARLLLGWLHSHTDAYLATVTVNQARRVFHTSVIPKQLAELEAAGFLTVVKGEQRCSFHLHAEPWMALFGRPTRRSEPQPTTPTTPPAPQQARRNRRAGSGAGGAPDPARLEDQQEHHLEGLAPVLALNSVESTAPPLSEDPHFKEFWSAYPKKAGKPSALRAWEKMLKKRVDHETLMDGLRLWCLYWSVKNEPQFIPHPERWLNDERWNDQPPPPPRGKQQRYLNGVPMIPGYVG